MLLQWFRSRIGVGLLVVGALLPASSAPLRGDDDPSRAIRDGFEGPGTAWEQEQTDATIKLLAHDRSRRAAHEGRLSEHFHFEAGPGSSFFYSYRKALPRVVVTDELKVGLFVRASRAGVRLHARVILPADTDPDTGQPSFVLVPGTTYENVDRWQRLDLVDMRPSIERQARVIRASTKRPVSLEGAYLDRVVVDLYCGAGETEVFLDELSVAPVPADAPVVPEGPVADEAPRPEAPPPASRPAVRVSMDLNRLKRNNYDWFFTAIEAPGADVAELRRAGFDVLVDEVDANPARFRDAIDLGFLLQPNLAVDGEPLDPSRAAAAAVAFPYRDAVAFWGLGEQLGRSDDPEERQAELERVRATVSKFRGLPRSFSHLTTATVADDFRLYGRAPQNLDVMGVRPDTWGSANKPNDTYTYLSQRRALTVHRNPEGLFCAWFPAAAPPNLQLNVWGDDVPPSWGYPAIQPEQIRHYVYLALAAGYRGIGFRGDANLTRPGNGRILRIEMALLNEEIDLFETLLAKGADPIPLYMTYPTEPSAIPLPGTVNVNQRVKVTKEADPNPFTRFAAIDTADRKTSLLLVNEFFDFMGCQPYQMAMNNLKINVPARESSQAWIINPGGVKLLEQREKAPGGIRWNVPDYGGTALILVTTDLALADRIGEQIKRVRPLAVQLAIEQAELQLAWVSEINGRLLADGHRLNDPNDPKTPKLPPGATFPDDEALLLGKCEESIKTAKEALEREDYQIAWDEARRASRPLRILMFTQWAKAFAAMVKVAAPYPEDPPQARLNVDRREKGEPKKPKKPPRPVILPVASPTCLAYNLLPQHYIWVDWMGKSFSRNLVPSGTFDGYSSLGSLEAAGWVDVSRPLEGVTSKIEAIRSSNDPKKRILQISVLPDDVKDVKKVDKLLPFIDHPIGAIRSPEVQVKAGQFLKISVELAKRAYTVPGHGGVIIRDSIGGEALQFRFTDPILELTPTVLFRRVPADGVVTVTLGMAAYGEAHFNNFRVEVAEGPSEGPPVPTPSPSPTRARVRGPAPSDGPASSPPLPDPSISPFPDPPISSAAPEPLPVPRANP